MRWRRKKIWRHGTRRQERLHASLVLASVTVLCCFRRIFPQVLPLGMDIRTFRVRGLRKIARHGASPG